MHIEKKAAVTTKLYYFVSSMKTGLLLLVLIGIASALGSTVLPDVFFHTVIFKLLLICLFINLCLCSINRLLWLKSAREKSKKTSRELFRQTSILLLHVGIVLILAGGIINATQGRSEQIRLIEGDTVSISRLLETKTPLVLQLDNFQIEFNPDGSPSQYYSYVTIWEDDKAKVNDTISVNHPLSYKGLKAYQTSYGNLVKTNCINSSGQQEERLLAEGEFLIQPETKRTIKIYRYIPNFDSAYGMSSKTIRPDNPRIVFSIYENEELLRVGAAKLDESIAIDANFQVVFTDVVPFSVLDVKLDPGLPVAAAGGVLFALGVSLALFLAPAKRSQNSNEIYPEK